MCKVTYGYTYLGALVAVAVPPVTYIQYIENTTFFPLSHQGWIREYYLQ